MPISPSYAAWFVRTHGLVDGRPVGNHALPGSDLAELWDPLPATTADREILRAAGVRTSVADLLDDPDGAAALLDRLADPDRPTGWETLTAVYRALATVHSAGMASPERVRVDPETVLPADRVVVIDAPQHLQLEWPDPPLVVPLGTAHALADVLDVAVSADRVAREAGPSGGARFSVWLPIPVTANKAAHA